LRLGTMGVPPRKEIRLFLMIMVMIAAPAGVR
jgi:hypothetical protein